MARTKGARTMSPQQNARYRAWRSMRMLRQFSVPDLMATAEIGQSNVGKYLQALNACGYLRIIKEKRDGSRGGHVRYMLIKNTGPNQPRCRSDGTLYDPNTGEVISYG